MRVLDDHGRVFGKINIIDAAVLTVVCFLIPLAYGTYVLFRTPLPQITAVEPPHIPLGTVQIMIRGANLRPYLRFTLGQVETKFLFQSPTTGVLLIPELPPGAYDVALYDEGQELGRVPGGLVIDGSNGNLMVLGAFRGLDATSAQALSQTLRANLNKMNAWGQVAGTQVPEPSFQYLGPSNLNQDATRYVGPSTLPVSDGTYEVSAVLRLRCVLGKEACTMGTVAIAPGMVLPIELPDGTADFRVEEIHPEYDSKVDLLVRIEAPKEVAELLASPERDAWRNFPARDTLRPSVISSNVEGQTPTKATIVTVRLRVPAVRISDEWNHAGRALRVGGYFLFVTPLYQVYGVIASISQVQGPAQQR